MIWKERNKFAVAGNHKLKETDFEQSPLNSHPLSPINHKGSER